MKSLNILYLKKTCIFNSFVSNIPIFIFEDLPSFCRVLAALISLLFMLNNFEQLYFILSYF